MNEENRLTPPDKEVMQRRMTTMLAEWSAATMRPVTDAVRWDWLPALERMGCNAIGCTADDLRPVELAWVHATAADLLGLDLEELAR